MSKPSTSLGLLALGVVAGEIALASAGTAVAAPPDWIKVTPRGPVTTRDARDYSFAPEALAARFTADGVDVPVDTNHALALRAIRGESVDALGYAAELQARGDGTYARVNWIDPPAAASTIRTHRYVSPTFFPDEKRGAVWLHSISLVAAPALSMPALLQAFGDPSESFMKQIAKALGLPENATEPQCLAALNARTETKPLALALGLPETTDAAACLAAATKAAGGLKPIARALELPETADEAACLSAIAKARSGGNAALETLQANLRTTSDTLAALQKTTRDKEVSELIEGALKERKITPAQRDDYVTLCATDEGLKTVRTVLAAAVPNLQGSGLDGRAPADGGALDPVTLAAKATKLQRERTEAGQPIGYAEAVALAAEQK